MPDGGQILTRWRPQPGPQTRAIDLPHVAELLFGGARGGGKSDFLLGDFCADANQGPGWRGVLFRQSYPELEELILRAQTLIPQCWPRSEWFKQEKTWHLPNGASLRMRNLESPEDAAHYQGHSYAWIGWDELTAWKDDKAYLMLMACLRSADGIKHMRVRATANPGGPGHAWVKSRFIDAAPHGYQPITDAQTGIPRVFIPSRVENNRILMARDPGYIDRLRGVGSPQLVRAWLEGDWNVVVGAYFPEFGARHVLRPFRIPAAWLRFRAMDWGSARPFCVLWLAVSDGTVPGIPTGALVVYREWYGASGPNVGLRLTAEQVADGIKEREIGDERIAYGKADPSMFASDGGPSLAERMALRRVMWQPADNTRVRGVGAGGGWDAVRQRLIGEDDVPMLYVFSTATALIRTLPALQHDSARPEDVDTDSEDHACFVAGTIVNGQSIEDFGYLTRCDTHTVLVKFADGYSVECTPDHKFFTESGAWTRADRLQSSRVWSAIPARSFWASAITAAAFTTSARVVDCIAWSGNIITGLCRKAATSITSMIIGPTTRLATSPSWTAGFTSRITIERTLHPRQETRRTLPPLSGTPATLAGNGIPRMPPDNGEHNAANMLRRLASSAGRLSRQSLSSRIARSSATSTAALVRCVGVEPQGARRDVYCLGSRTGWVRLANGVIASNCDTLRYAVASRPWVAAPPPADEHLTLEKLWAFRDQQERRFG